MAVRICPRICFCGESISKNTFRWFESGYKPEKNEIVRCTMKSERGSDEIFSLRLQMISSLRSGKSASISRRKADFIAKRFHPPKVDLVEKSTCLRRCFLLWRVSDLDAKPCVADLDAGRFCRGYGKPLAMMGVALYRYLPGCNSMLANEAYVLLTTTVLLWFFHSFLCL